MKYLGLFVGYDKILAKDLVVHKRIGKRLCNGFNSLAFFGVRSTLVNACLRVSLNMQWVSIFSDGKIHKMYMSRATFF
jgi:hypothetical protein